MPGFTVTAWYWDIESGALDLADRSKGEAWRQIAAGLAIPRDGGLTELLADAARPDRPDRPFDVVICEGIDRIARDTLASLTVKRSWPGTA
jgi:site-specific DNA recombinase